MRIRDRLFLESDNECALCGIRGSHVLTIHHIDGNHENNAYENQVVVCNNCHIAHNQGNGFSTEDIRATKRILIMKTMTQVGINALKEAARREIVYGAPYLLNHLVDLGYLQLKQPGDLRSPEGGPIIYEGAYYEATEKGRTVLEEWDL